jgi:hypothetical protein
MNYILSNELKCLDNRKSSYREECEENVTDRDNTDESNKSDAEDEDDNIDVAKAIFDSEIR